MIRKEDLEGKRIVDLGCNLGGSTLLAAEAGAIAVGWDRNPKYIEVASRLAVLFGSSATFEARDVSDHRGESWDTGFCFSVARHGDVLETIRRCSVVYFETNIRDRGRVPPEIRSAWAFERLGATSRGGRLVFRMVRK